MCLELVRSSQERPGVLAADVFPGNGKLASPGRGASAAPPRGGGPQAGARAPKKSGGVLREGVAVKYACIRQHRGEFAMRLMCRALGVSPSGFYAASRR